MDGILAIIGVIVVIAVGRWLIGILFKGGAAAVTAAAKSATGKGSFSSSFRDSFSGPSSLEIRLQEVPSGDDDEHTIQHIDARGMFPIDKSVANAAFYTSVLDETDGESKAVLTPFGDLQEPESVAYFFNSPIGSISPNQYFPDWVTIGVVPPHYLNFPGSGKRKLKVIVRLVDLLNPPDIGYGFGDAGLWASVLDYEYFAEEKGYEEEQEHRDEARELCLKIAMAVAMADGSLDKSEGEVLKQWVRETIAPFSDEKQKELKELYNNAMRTAHKEAAAGELTLGESTARLNAIGERKRKLEAVELAYLVMNADGRIERSEIEVIKNVTKSLGLSADEIAQIRDRQLVSFDGQATIEGGLEEVLGIDPSWSREEINRYLRREYQKWNGRLSSLPAGPERELAQKMLNLIGEARKNYDS